VVGRLQAYDAADQAAPKLHAADGRHGVSDPCRLRLGGEQRPEFALQSGGGERVSTLALTSNLGCTASGSAAAISQSARVT